jgi:hypothetical protein
MKHSELTTHGKNSTTWVNNAPPIKGNMPTKMLVKGNVSFKAWKLVLGLLAIAGWVSFIFTR